jgi:hypothetical protein
MIVIIIAVNKIILLNRITNIIPDTAIFSDLLSLQLSQRNLLAENPPPPRPFQKRLALYIADVYCVEPLSAQNNCLTELTPFLSLPFGIIHFYITLSFILSA